MVAALLLALAISDSRGGWAAESATVQEIRDGQELYINQKQAAPKDRASAPQTVSTRNSRGQLAFSTGAAGRINRFSLLKLGSSCFLVEKGQILVSGKQNGCTRSARLSVRGTNYLIDVQEDGSAELSVLEGSVDVEQLQDGESTGKPATAVEAGQKVKLSAQGVLLTLLRLSSGDYNAILSGPLFSGVLLAVDRTTGAARAEPVPNKTTAALSAAFEQSWISIFGAPESVVSAADTEHTEPRPIAVCSSGTALAVAFTPPHVMSVDEPHSCVSIHESRWSMKRSSQFWYAARP
jgi:hypothetical protein